MKFDPKKFASPAVAKKKKAPAADAGAAPQPPKPFVAPTAITEVEEIEGLPDIWFASNGKPFWRLNGAEYIDYTETEFKRLLKTKGFPSKPLEGRHFSPLEDVMVKMQHKRRVDWAGPLAGYKPGRYEICGKQFLIPTGPNLPKLKRGSWKTIRKLIVELLGDKRDYFYGWMKSAHASLENGFPWRPGQLLAIAGPRGCGKSLLQNLITLMLGGRSCKPYGYLCGEEKFNAAFFGSEHWMIEDEASSTDIRVRRHFGAMIKNALVNNVQNMRGMFKDSLAVTPYLRMTMSLNDEVENLMTLPPLEEDITDKIILLRAYPATVPDDSEVHGARKAFWDQLVSEIPAFLEQLQRWEITDEMSDVRFGVKAFQDPDLTVQLESLSPEAKLLNWIDTSGIWEHRVDGMLTLKLQGTQVKIEKLLRSWDGKGELNRMLSWSSACGIFLSRLARKQPKRVTVERLATHQNFYSIFAPE